MRSRPSEAFRVLCRLLVFAAFAAVEISVHPPVLRQALHEVPHGAHVHSIVALPIAPVAGRPVLGLEVIHHVGDPLRHLRKVLMPQLHLPATQ